MDNVNLVAPLAGPPVLSTPNDEAFQVVSRDLKSTSPQLDDDQVYETYEIERTAREIRAGKWHRIALQFPDQSLKDAPRVYRALSRRLAHLRRVHQSEHHISDGKTTMSKEPASTGVSTEGTETGDVVSKLHSTSISTEHQQREESLFILGDTSYGACCADEIAAEHADADVLVHYGRSCLSRTARLPVIYCFTKPPLDLSQVAVSFRSCYENLHDPIVLMADVPYAAYVFDLSKLLGNIGYTNLFATEVVHDTSSPLPNRTVPPGVVEQPQHLQMYHIFHIAQPPPALLLTLSSRVASVQIYDVNEQNDSQCPQTPLLASTKALQRRYGLVVTVSTVGIFGILINTLSVKNYLHVVDRVKQQIADAGKKSYTFVVGKVNAAKVANFSEIGAWVVVGCWESSLVESSDFWRPIITPFELQLALQSDNERVWTGQWSSDFQSILAQDYSVATQKSESISDTMAGSTDEHNGTDQANTSTGDGGPLDSEEESDPPEFDLRTGRYVSHSRPMTSNISSIAKQSLANDSGDRSSSNGTLIKRQQGEVASIGGVASPGAEFLRSNRTWRGLGSDFDAEPESSNTAKDGGAKIEQGRRGIARGYALGDDPQRT